MAHRPPFLAPAPYDTMYDPTSVPAPVRAATRAEQDFRAIVIANSGEHFCVGANLFLIVMAASQQNWDQIRSIVKSLQDNLQRLKYARVPVVAAPTGRIRDPAPCGH